MYTNVRKVKCKLYIVFEIPQDKSFSLDLRIIWNCLITFMSGPFPSQEPREDLK